MTASPLMMSSEDERWDGLLTLPAEMSSSYISLSYKQVSRSVSDIVEGKNFIVTQR